MDDLSPSSLKSILHSKRANIYYLEYCRVMQKDGRVLYLTEAKKENLYFNIPIANTTVLLLGNGTSITQAAMRMLSQAGVLVGFSGGGGTPLYMANNVEHAIEWMTPKANTDQPNTYTDGCNSGLMTQSALPQVNKYKQHVFNTLTVYGKKMET